MSSEAVMTVLGIGIAAGLVLCIAVHRMNKKTDLLLQELKKRNEHEYQLSIGNSVHN
jgi:hypothetical protein